MSTSRPVEVLVDVPEEVDVPPLDVDVPEEVLSDELVIVLMVMPPPQPETVMNRKTIKRPGNMKERRSWFYGSSLCSYENSLCMYYSAKTEH